MKLIPIKCPNCGSKLEITPNSKMVTCEYCEYEFLVNDEVKLVKLEDAEQAGYKLGLGMQRAVWEANEANDDDPTKPPINKEKLIQRLKEIRAHISQTAGVERKLQDAQERLREANVNLKRYIVNLWLFIALFFALIIYWIFDSSTLAFGIGIFIAIINFMGNNFNESKKNDANKIIAECKPIIAENRANLPYTFVVPELCNVKIIDEIINSLEMGRADNYKEAVNFYISDKQNAEAIQASRDAAQAARDAEYASIAAANAANKARKEIKKRNNKTIYY